MDLSQFRFKDLYSKWIFGLIEGLVIGILLISAIQPFFEFLLLILQGLSIAMLILLIQRKEKATRKTEKQKKKGCPECGSTARHKRGCSKAKKKE